MDFKWGGGGGGVYFPLGVLKILIIFKNFSTLSFLLNAKTKAKQSMQAYYWLHSRIT